MSDYYLAYYVGIIELNRRAIVDLYYLILNCHAEYYVDDNYIFEKSKITGRVIVRRTASAVFTERGK